MSCYQTSYFRTQKHYIHTIIYTNINIYITVHLNDLFVIVTKSHVISCLALTMHRPSL